MALIHSMESNGNKLFRYRGQIPILLFIAAFPVIFFTDVSGYGTGLIGGFRAGAIALSTIGFVIRAIAIGSTPKGTSGRNTQKQVAASLNSTGIYSIVRHPLYLGNYFMWIGIVAYTFNVYYIIIVSLAYWIYYERIMFAEERFLERKFGDSYVKWSLQVPPFWPRFSNYTKSTVPFSLKPVLRREYSGILATVTGFVYVDIIRDYLVALYSNSTFQWSATYTWVMAAATGYALIFRSVKHYTNWLDEEGRS